MIIHSRIYAALFFLMTFFLLMSSGCKEDEEVPVILETGTMTDIEGNIYMTVKIGSQWWMAENLKVKRYRDSSLITQANTDVQWSTDTAGAYTPYGNYDNITNASVYGYLYNWHAVRNTSSLAPTGWHIPTDEEWKTLEREIGMSATETDNSGWRGSDEGEKLKKESPQGWTQYSDVWSTNESGFTALAGGCRLFDGRPTDPGLFATGFWWTSSTYTGTNSEAWYRYLDYKKKNVFRSTCSKNYGYSIRCVKD